MIRYAEAEAAALIRENLDVAEALVSAILVCGTLTGDEIDEVIARAISTRAAEAERKHRADWRERTESARAFLTDVTSSAGLVRGVRHARHPRHLDLYPPRW